MTDKGSARNGKTGIQALAHHCSFSVFLTCLSLVVFHSTADHGTRQHWRDSPGFLVKASLVWHWAWGRVLKIKTWKSKSLLAGEEDICTTQIHAWWACGPRTLLGTFPWHRYLWSLLTAWCGVAYQRNRSAGCWSDSPVSMVPRKCLTGLDYFGNHSMLSFVSCLGNKSSCCIVRTSCVCTLRSYCALNLGLHRGRNIWSLMVWHCLYWEQKRKEFCEDLTGEKKKAPPCPWLCTRKGNTNPQPLAPVTLQSSELQHWVRTLAVMYISTAPGRGCPVGHFSFLPCSSPVGAQVLHLPSGNEVTGQQVGAGRRKQVPCCWVLCCPSLLAAVVADGTP